MIATICSRHRTCCSNSSINNTYWLSSRWEWRNPSQILPRNRWSPRCQSRKTQCSPMEWGIPTTTKPIWAWGARRRPSSSIICFNSIWSRNRPWLKRFILPPTTITTLNSSQGVSLAIPWRKLRRLEALWTVTNLIWLTWRTSCTKYSPIRFS